MSKSKKTAYFYAGIIILVLMLGMFIFQIANYNTQINMYVASYGYEKEYVKEMIPFWSTVLPEFSDIFTSYGLMALIAFGINCILNAIRNDQFILDDFEMDELIESITDPDGDGRTIFEEIQDELKEAADKAEEKIDDIKDKIEDKFDKED